MKHPLDRCWGWQFWVSVGPESGSGTASLGTAVGKNDAVQLQVMKMLFLGCRVVNFFFNLERNLYEMLGGTVKRIRI